MTHYANVKKKLEEIVSRFTDRKKQQVEIILSILS